MSVSRALELLDWTTPTAPAELADRAHRMMGRDVRCPKLQLACYVVYRAFS